MKNKLQKENLRWLNPSDGSNYHAGVAFYNKEHGDYRIILDAPRTIYNLVPYCSTDGQIKYKAYAPVSKNGKFSHKIEIGHAVSTSGGDIYITVGRYASLRLVITSSKVKA